MATTDKPMVLTSPIENFPQWYQDVLDKAELSDNGPVRGTMVIRPYGYALWERMQAGIDARIKACGASNVYLPLFIPESYLHREAEHIEGFSPELAVVTHAGGKELAEPVVVRPTSETLFGEMMSKWVQSHRDLPMLLNQWANVVRWELRPRMFLRTTEFLWQEGHCAHASQEDGAAYARKIHYEVYKDFIENVMAIPVLVGAKTAHERFAGAIATLTCESMMGDGKALQMATSHELGQNFARAFDIGFSAESGLREHCWTTSWGSSTRMVGGLVMAHGDRAGLVMPPLLAPVQVIVIAVRPDPAVDSKTEQLVAELNDLGVRAEVDRRSDVGFGRRVTNWELKGVPLRVELGPRDLAAGVATVVRRFDGRKEQIPLGGVASHLRDEIARIQSNFLEVRRSSLAARTVDTESLEEAKDAAQVGFARIPWRALGSDGERQLLADAISVRCLQTVDGEVPASGDLDEAIAVVGRSY